MALQFDFKQFVHFHSEHGILDKQKDLYRLSDKLRNEVRHFSTNTFHNSYFQTATFTDLELELMSCPLLIPMLRFS